MKSKNRRSIWRTALKAVRFLLFSVGGIALIMILLALTTLPFHGWYRAGMKYAGITRPPGYIVLLGGGGMPSESNLMRAWYAAGVARYYPEAKVIIALPGDRADSLSAVSRLIADLVMKGVPPERILVENKGTNTRSQALETGNLIREQRRTVHPATPNGTLPAGAEQASLLLITSPEHLPRAVRVFRKAGFQSTDGLPAFEQPLESNLTFDDLKLGGRKAVPGIGNNLTFRYEFWRQLDYELLLLREWTATAYYRLKGWI